MRRSRMLIALVSALAMVLMFSLGAAAHVFSDVEDDAPYADAFTLLHELAIFEGYGDGRVGPDDFLTREQFSTVVIRALGEAEAAAAMAEQETTFEDDEAISDWARGHVNKSVEMGIVKGYPDNTFGPQNNLTYTEAFTMLLRALGLGEGIDDDNWEETTTALAQEVGLDEGLAGTEGNITRADMAIATVNALKANVAWDAEEGKVVEGEGSLLDRVHEYEPAEEPEAEEEGEPEEEADEEEGEAEDEEPEGEGDAEGEGESGGEESGEEDDTSLIDKIKDIRFP